MDDNTNLSTEPTLIAADQQDGATVIESTKPEPPKPEPAKDYAGEIEKLKAALSRANSQAAEYKRQRNEAMDKSKLAEVERAEQEAAMREELETLRKEKDVGDSVARALALKVEGDTATKLAEAWSAHDKESFFSCLGEIIQETTTRLSNELLNKQPALSTGVPPSKNTAEDEFTAQLMRYAGLSPRR